MDLSFGVSGGTCLSEGALSHSSTGFFLQLLLNCSPEFRESLFYIRTYVLADVDIPKKFE